MTAQVCAHCSAPVRARSVGTPICAADMAKAEATFRRDHSPRDADWIPARNRAFGTGAAILALLARAERTAA